MKNPNNTNNKPTTFIPMRSRSPFRSFSSRQIHSLPLSNTTSTSNETSQTNQTVSNNNITELANIQTYKIPGPISIDVPLQTTIQSPQKSTPSLNRGQRITITSSESRATKGRASRSPSPSPQRQAQVLPTTPKYTTTVYPITSANAPPPTSPTNPLPKGKESFLNRLFKRGRRGGYNTRRQNRRGLGSGFKVAWTRHACRRMPKSAKDKAAYKKWLAGRSIGFTERSHLKALGVIPRANGTCKVSPKYR
jgi:hypothetical protein